MIKTLIKLVCKPAKLAQYAADGIQAAVNQSDKEAQIAKWAKLADEVTEVQKWVTSTLVDGKIDDVERDEIKAKLEPVFSKLMEMV